MSEKNDRSASGEPRRPLLAGGERLREHAVRPPHGRPPANPFEASAFERLAPQAQALETAVRTLPDSLRGQHVVLEATLYANFLANSHYPRDTVERHRLYLVGQRGARAPYQTATQFRPDAETKALLLAGEANDVLALARAIGRGPTSSDVRWQEVARIHALGVPSPDRVLRPGTESAPAHWETWEAVLVPTGRTLLERERHARDTFAKFAAVVRSNGGDVDEAFRRDVANLVYVPVWLDLSAAQAVTRFNLLRALRPMPKLRPLPRPMMRALFAQAIAPGIHEEPRATTRAAIFDGGFATGVAALAKFAMLYHLTPEKEDDACVRHGSMVTGACLYGHLATPQSLPRPNGFFDHYRVLPVPRHADDGAPKFDHDSMWIADRIAETLANRPYPLVNLSIGPDVPVSDEDVPDYFTTMLDELAIQYGTQFVTAAGNNGADDAETGMNRVLVPSDMANGISVGACDSPVKEHTASKVRRASYSPVGPGRDGQRVSPFGVQFGGCPSNQSFAGVDHHGRLTHDHGTSFATPLVTRGLHELVGSIAADRWSPATARAFAAHFARREKRGHRTIETGFGLLPESYGRFWECASNECTVLYQDGLERGQAVAMMLPFPRDVPDDVPISLSLTVAYDASVDPAGAVEYTRDGLELTFRPNERMRRVVDAATDDEVAVLDIDREHAKLQDIMSKRAVIVREVPVSASGTAYRNESWLRDSGKWCTLIRREMPARPAASFFRPRLDVNYLRREGGMLVSEDVPAMRVTMLVTLRTPDGIPLYDLIEQQYDRLSPLVNLLHVSHAA